MLTEIRNTIDANLSEILALRNTKKLKEDNSFVTEGDLLCQELILQVIEKHSKENSIQYEIVSEEIDSSSFNYNPEKNYVVIDPIDGTENFTSGLLEWGIAICIYHQNKHHQSMLFLPELKQWLVTGDSFKSHESRISGISSSLTKEDLQKLPDGFEYRIIGCCVYNMFNVIRGSYFSFENPKGAKVWDILPGLNLALEQGLNVTVEGEKYCGEFLSPNKKYRFKVSR